MASYRIPHSRLQHLLDRLDVDGNREAVEKMLEYPDDVFRPVLELVLTERLPLSSLTSTPDPHTMRAISAQVDMMEEGSVDEIVENIERFLVEGVPPDIYYTRDIGHEVDVDDRIRLEGDHPTHTRLSRNIERSVPGPLEQMLGAMQGIDPRKVSQGYPGLHRREE